MSKELSNHSLANSCQIAMHEAIQNIAVGPDRGRNISRESASLVMSGILNREVDEVQAAVFLIALRMKRESIDEFLGLFDALQDSTATVTADVDDLLLLADPFNGYVRNISITPFIPATLSACGLNSVMHGVETVGPKHGVTAHKVLKLAGINTTRSAKDVANRLADIGWGYVDQSCYAPELFALQDLRDRIVKRTALTTLERLLIPIKGKLNTHLVLGYVHKAYPEIYATVARVAGYKNLLLLKGVEGGLAPALNKPLRRFFFNDELPDDIEAQKQLIESQLMFDAKSAARGAVNSNHPVEECLDVGLDVLGGIKSISRDSLCLSSAQILIAHQPHLSLPEAVEKVQMCLDNGSAKAHFNALI